MGRHLPQSNKAALFGHIGDLFDKLGMSSSSDEVDLPYFVERSGAA